MPKWPLRFGERRGWPRVAPVNVVEPLWKLKILFRTHDGSISVGLISDRAILTKVNSAARQFYVR
jgi:hypothetical protein